MVSFSPLFRHNTEIFSKNAKDYLIKEMLRTLSKEPFDNTLFDEFIGKITQDYQRVNQKINSGEVSVPKDFSKMIGWTWDAIVYISGILEKLKGDTISKNDENILFEKVTVIFQNSNKICENSTYLRLFNVLKQQEIPKGEKNKSWFRRFFMTTAIGATLWGGAGQKDYASFNSISENKTISAANTVASDKNFSNAINYKEIQLAKEIMKNTNVDTLTQGFNKPIFMDSVLATAYTPTGKGLMAGSYEETGKTSTGNPALNNFDGIAVVDSLIPYGSLVYIKGLGWKVADDTGGQLWTDARKKGKVHIDVRMDDYDKAKLFGSNDTSIVVLTPKSIIPKGIRPDTWRYNLVEEGRKIVRELNRKNSATRDEMANVPERKARSNI